MDERIDPESVTVDIRGDGGGWVAEAWLEVNGVWAVIVEARLLDGRLAITKFSIEPVVAVGETGPFYLELTATRLRQIPLGAIRGEILRQILLRPRVHDWWAEHNDPFPPRDVELAEKAALEADSTERKRPRGRPPQYDENHWRQLALRRLELEASGERNTTAALASEYSVTPDTIRTSWIPTCRRLGFLGPSGGPGNRGALPGPRLREGADE